MLGLITLFSCFVILSCIICYDKHDRNNLLMSVVAYFIAVMAGVYAINTLFERISPDVFTTILFSMIAIATYRKRGNVACFFKES